MYKKYPVVVEIKLASGIEHRWDGVSSTESCLCCCEIVGGVAPWEIVASVVSWERAHTKKAHKVIFHKDDGILELLGGIMRTSIDNKNFSLEYLGYGTLRFLPEYKGGPFYL